MEQYNFLDFSVNCQKHALYKSGEKLEIGATAFNILLVFLQNPEQVIKRDKLFAQVWPGKVISDASLYKQVQRLREILKDTTEVKTIITTVHGVGFEFLPEIKTTQPKGKTKNKSKKTIFLSLIFIGLIVISTGSFMAFLKKPSLYEDIEMMRNAMSLGKKAFISQINQRNELGKLLANRFEIPKSLSWERRFFKYRDKMNAEELFVYKQIKAYTDGPLFSSNEIVLNLINNNKKIMHSIPLASDLRNHLTIWLNKYERVFRYSENMCLLYIGVEDGAPYPSAVDQQVIDWLKANKNTSEK